MGSSKRSGVALYLEPELRERLCLAFVGQRVKGVAVTVVKIRNTEFSTMVRMVAKNGHRLTWFASGYVGMQEGQEAEIAAAVKKHDDYRGQKSTIVTRVKVQDQGVAA